MPKHPAGTLDASYSRFVALAIPVCAVALFSLVAGAVPAAGEEPPQVSHDGLHLVPDSKVAVAYVKPGADFSPYRRILLLDAYVAFKKNWARDKNRGSLHHVTQRDMEQIKQATAELFREVFVEVLDTEGGYPVVDGAGEDVLLLRPAIIDLDVTAPDVDRLGRSYNFASSAGAATLYMELYDSVSSEILARVIDRQAARHGGDFMRWTNKVTNRADARRVIAGWAKLLHQGLDELHGETE